MKKEETNDIIQFLIPKLEEIGIEQDNCKIDVTTEKSGNKRGDIWISLKKQDNKDFESNIIALIEAKHKNAIIGDMDWRDAMRQGKEKASKQGLNYYIVTNCRDDFRFYNTHDDEEIIIDGKTIIKLVPLDILQKINTQISKDNSYVIHKAIEATRPFSEDKFRITLKQLADVYRSAGLKKGDERIDPTVSFVVIKYISENEKQKRTLNKAIKLWDNFREVAKGKEEGDLKSMFDTIVKQIWGKDSEYKNNIYEDFKDLIGFSSKLKNEHFKKIFNLLDDKPLHGVNFDLFGVIYEEFASQTKKKEFGEFYTRRHITNMVSTLLLRNEIVPRPLKICDPACGTGGFLTEAYKVLETLYSENGKLNPDIEKDLKEKIFWGYDNDNKSVARTQINMFLVGDGHVHIYENDDSLLWNKTKGWKDNKFDYIITNPPMGKYTGTVKIEDFKFTNERRCELLFVEKVIEATRNGGGIGIVVNDGALETPSRELFRKKLLQNCDIHAIVSLTKFAFAPYTKEKTYILFMQKKQTDEVGTIQNTPIWHFILDYDGYANSDKRFKTKYHDDIPELEDKFDGAMKLAKQFLQIPERFEQEIASFEREVNEREREEGLWGLKCGFVVMDKVNKDNFHNLLSEFHLRPVTVEKINEGEFNNAIVEIIDELSSLDAQINELRDVVVR